jgi:hypothetical protein
LWNIIDKFQRLDPKIVGLSPELQAEVERLEAERNAIEQRCDEPEDYSQEDDVQERREIARLDEIEDRLESIASGGRAFTEEQRLFPASFLASVMTASWLFIADSPSASLRAVNLPPMMASPKPLILIKCPARFRKS